MNLKKCILVNNDCYKSGKKITVKGLMLHSTGANNPNLKRYVQPDDGYLGLNVNNNHWNTAKPDGQSKCTHGFIGKLADGSIATYQTLEWDHRGWHAGGTANDSYIGVEICEDGLTDGNYFNAVYKEAVELFAYLCTKFNLNPLTDIICHSEGYTKGIASNHCDVMHWFPKHGKSMDTFRNDVKITMGNRSNNTVTVQNVPTGDKLNIRTAPNADSQIVGQVDNGTTFILYGVENGCWGKTPQGYINLHYTDYKGQLGQAQKTYSYYPACNSKYNSLVDALNSVGVNSNFENRKKIAQRNNIKDYSGTANQNEQLLSKLKAGRLIK